MRTVLIIILTLFSLLKAEAEVNIADVDSIAIIIRPKALDSLKLDRRNFVQACAEHSKYKIPIFLNKEKKEIAEIIMAISSDSICMHLDYDTKLDVLRLQKKPTGDYDLNRGFSKEDDMNIYALVSIFKHDTIQFIWIGKNEVDIGRDRYLNKDIYKHLVALLLILAGETQLH